MCIEILRKYHPFPSNLAKITCHLLPSAPHLKQTKDTSKVRQLVCDGVGSILKRLIGLFLWPIA
jgi:hypothetical protein